MEGNSIVGAAMTGAKMGAIQSGAAAARIGAIAAQGATAGAAPALGGVAGAAIAGAAAGASAASKLNEVITLLTIKSALSKASKTASSLSSIFSGANGNLAGSWANVSEFANTINKRVEELIKRFSDELQAFAATTEQNEQEITTATNNANDLASNILAELGL